MTNAKHTPGPWSRNIKPAHKYVTVWSGRNTHVAYVATGGPLSNEEIEANICLIAAAPELLAALRECVTEPGAPSIRLNDFEVAERRLAYISEIARRAIAKAEGAECQPHT